VIQRISPEIYVNTPAGEGHAMFLIDYGPMINTVWIVHLFKDGSVIHVDSPEVKIMGNQMYGIKDPVEPVERMRGRDG
jgi:hypothetical protein|tara:strand:- start:748 stop:981 length:234 start_codon:yes stop_codon:yes gene_type:complete